jgi:hypothetical protein
MSTVGFFIIVFVLYSVYYAVNILFDMSREKNLQHAVSLQRKNVITADHWKDEEEPIYIKPSVASQSLDTSKALKQTVRDITTALELETISYGIAISPENVAALFAD